MYGYSMDTSTSQLVSLKVLQFSGRLPKLVQELELWLALFS